MNHILAHTGKPLDSAGEEAADSISGFGLHRGGDVGVGVQGEACGVMAQHGGQGFDVYAVLEGQDGKCVAERVKRNFLYSCPFQYPLKHVQDAVRRNRASNYR